jgi:hypothetical protein
LTEIVSTQARLKTPRAAAVAGILFSVLTIVSLVLIRLTIPATPQEEGDWLAEGWDTVSLALNLLPFAGIAFLWFIGVIRDRLGAHEDRFFATVFLGSGLLFLAMLFSTAAMAGGILRIYGAAPGAQMDADVYAYGRAVMEEIMSVYTNKMAGVFMITTSTLALRTGIVPRWMAYLGLALAVVLLLSLAYFAWAILVLPLWVLLISTYILIANLGQTESQEGGAS